MGLDNSIDDIFQRVIKRYLIEEASRLLEQRIERINHFYQVAVISTNKETAKIVKKKIDAAAMAVATMFYSDYRPKYYNRTYSLFQLIETEEIPIYNYLHGFKVDVDAGDTDRMTTMRADGKCSGASLYNLVYEQGYHGGPGYRVPYTDNKVPGDGYFTRWSSNSAKRLSPPPEARLVNEIARINESAKNIGNQIFKSNLKKYDIDKYITID